MSALLINEVLIGVEELEEEAISSEVALIGIILGGVGVIVTNRFGAHLGGVPMRESELIAEVDAVLNAGLSRLDEDDGEALERETDRLRRLSARDEIAVLQLVSMDSNGPGMGGTASFFCSSEVRAKP